MFLLTGDVLRRAPVFSPKLEDQREHHCLGGNQPKADDHRDQDE